MAPAAASTSTQRRFGNDDTGGVAFAAVADTLKSAWDGRRWLEGRKCGIWRSASGGGRVEPVPPPASSTPFIGPFAAGGRLSSALPWKPSMEADVDTDNPLVPAVAAHSQPLAGPAAAARGARWRQRDVTGASRQHVDLPLDEPGTAAPPDDAPQHALHDAELWQLARRANGATLRLDFELRTALVRQVFRRDFVYVSRLLHALEASRRVQGLDRAALNDALAALQRRAADLETLFQRIRADLQAAIDARAPANARIAFARPARFQATLVSPAAHRYLTLLVQADDTLARLEMAWLLGLIEPASRAGLTSDCRRALHGFKDLAGERRQAVGEQVREINAQRREGLAAGSGA
jgi:hypothetical protein